MRKLYNGQWSRFQLDESSSKKLKGGEPRDGVGSAQPRGRAWDFGLRKESIKSKERRMVGAGPYEMKF